MSSDEESPSYEEDDSDDYEDDDDEDYEESPEEAHGPILGEGRGAGQGTCP